MGNKSFSRLSKKRFCKPLIFILLLKFLSYFYEKHEKYQLKKMQLKYKISFIFKFSEAHFLPDPRVEALLIKKF